MKKKFVFGDPFPSVGGDAGPLLSLYLKYLKDPDSVPLDWRISFENLDTSTSDKSEDILDFLLTDLKSLYQNYGHLSAKIDPLQQQQRQKSETIRHSEQKLQKFLSENYKENKELVNNTLERAKELESLYCGSVGLECAHILDIKKRQWICNRFEALMSELPTHDERLSSLKLLIKTNEFEKFCGIKYPTKKRFGSEGAETAFCVVQNLFDNAIKTSIHEIVIGGMHRGRLCLLQNLLEKPAEEIFAELNDKNFFTETDYLIGDVPYHMGHSTKKYLGHGKLKVSLLPHPSHLLVVAGCALGKTRGKQISQAARSSGRENTLCILMHTDAAFSGQGLVSEILQLSQLNGFSVGGTIHIIVNNQIGFTTSPPEGRSSRYCTDVAKMIDAPIIHVNADDTDSVIQMSKLALEWRSNFQSDIFIDLVCYRRFGHNELDEPTFTQPSIYKQIFDHPSVKDIYQKKLESELGNISHFDKSIKDTYREELQKAFETADSWKPNRRLWLTEKWSKIVAVDEAQLSERQDTGVPLNNLSGIAKKISSTPKDFSIHKKLQKFLQNRHKSFFEDENVNWATAEALAISSLLLEGHPVRISGQDVVRGTFTQRHWAFHDTQSENVYFPMQNLSDIQASFEAHNSPLAEYSVLSYEYGHSLVDPNQLTIWEAQFGDFANGAQIVIDQVIAPSEARWRRMTGLVLLLPHGLEGQGPDHSSCRLERFLSLCADGNMIVSNCTTPANYFHLLRRQLKANFRKPLIIATPKSLLRDKACVSSVQELCPGNYFEPLTFYRSCQKLNVPVERVIICSGKIKYALKKTILKYEEKCERLALISLEQIYPFPEKELCNLLETALKAKIIWCQEEPKNQGCWAYVRDKIESAILKVSKRKGTVANKLPTVACVARSAKPAPEGGSYNEHLKEEKSIVFSALGLRS